MKFWSRAVRILLATIVATQGAAFIPAMAASQSKRLAVKAIGIEELKSEFGAGGGGGSSDPVVVIDPGDGGEPGGCYVQNPDCSLQVSQTIISDEVITTLESDAYTGDSLWNPDAFSSQPKSKYYSDGCTVVLDSAAGFSIPAGISIGVAVQCQGVTVSAVLPPRGTKYIYRTTVKKSWAESKLLAYWRISTNTSVGYAGTNTFRYTQTMRTYSLGPLV